MFDHLKITSDWDGKGLPPIGERVGVSTRAKDGSYEQAVVVRHVPNNNELVAIVVYCDHKDWHWGTHDDDDESPLFIPWKQAKLRSA